MPQVIAQQNDTLDLICWRHYGRTAQVTELALAANPGLSEHGPIIPHGTTVNLPEDVPKPVKEVVNLWS